MAFFANNSAIAASFAGHLNASRNPFMVNADPDYFINPLQDDDDAYDNNESNISLACNAAMNESCVWQGFVVGDAEEEDFSVAAPSEYESRVRCGTSEAAVAFAREYKSCFKRGKEDKCKFTPCKPSTTPTPPPTHSYPMPYSHRRPSSSMSGSMHGSIIIGGGSQLGGGQQQLLLQLLN